MALSLSLLQAMLKLPQAPNYRENVLNQFSPSFMLSWGAPEVVQNHARTSRLRVSIIIAGN